MSTIDYYRVLQVPYGASHQTISRAYWRLAHECHEAMESQPELADLMEELNAAYEVLGTPHLRHQYDQALNFGKSDDVGERLEQVNWWRSRLRALTG